MGEKIIVGPIDKGLKNNREPFVIDNDSFPKLINAYQWRGRIKRKRGTQFLTRLRRFFNSTSISYSANSTFNLVGGAGNILTGFSLQINGNIFPGSVTITDTNTGEIYTDPAKDGTLSGSLGGSGTINYATGDITIAGGGADAISATFQYYPDLPVLGLEDFKRNTSAFPGTIGFDTTYSYIIQTIAPYTAYDISFYKNLSSGTYPGYTQKTFWTPTTWNGQNYQQFWSTNYQGAFWVTNGINVPFSITNIGMQFKPILTVTVTSGGPPAIATLQITGHGLVVGDFVFINEVATTTGINFQTGYVVSVINANNVSVEFPNAIIATNGTGGIAQYLTSRANPTVDCIRWFDGDPTDGNVLTPGFSTGRGWVNFMPPLSLNPYSIAQTPPAIYYLVGARMIAPFKDRLLFVGPVIQSSSGSPIYLQDTVIFSQNGTPFYTASFVGDQTNVTQADRVFNPILVPQNQTATAPAWIEDQTGFGGFLSAGLDEPATTLSSNEDVLMIGFDPNIQTKLIYSGSDIQPFNFYLINSEYGSSSTFSSVNLDKGVITIGNRGIVITSQDQCSRIDLDIPDQVFQFNLFNNGNERVTSQRDFINEWVYFTYISNELSPKGPTTYTFPNQTLFFNYRDNSWAIFNESYTHYGQFRKQTGFTWSTVGTVYPTWEDWNDPWDSGESNLLQPDVIAGNQQGFVFIRSEGTGEQESLYIRNINGSANLVTSPDHCLNVGDYIFISDSIGTISSQVNGKIFSVVNPTKDTFQLNPTITTGTYLGQGVITRLYIPQIQTKQFPVSWGMARKTRLGVQQYLLTKTQNAQITLLIFLSQNASYAYNSGAIVPRPNVQNSSLIYSTVLHTCPESTNLGLTPANVNIMMPTAIAQQQIWHRKNTSLLGDTIQIGFTLSDAQMRFLNANGSFRDQTAEIELHSLILDVTPSQLLV